MLKVGLTGNYAMGKSTVTAMFKSLGAFVIDADDVVASLLKEPSVIAEIVDYFSENILINNEINKKLLADVVFNNPVKRLQLENIIHPKVFSQIEKTLESCQTCPISIIEASLIFERGFQNRFDKIITVYTDEATCLKRAKLKNIPDTEVQRRWNCQLPIRQKISGADYVIDNSKDLASTEAQVKQIWKDLLKHANNI